MLAIVVPYYKVTFFEQTLLSLANQTDKRFKVYIGDDASTESPIVLLKSFRGKIDFKYHRFEFNLGETSLVQQWERCIALSEDEEWIMILGDDDLLDNNVVEEFYKHYDVFIGKTNLVRFATQNVNFIELSISCVFSHPDWETASDAYFRRFQGLTRSSLSEYIFRREVYLQFKFHNYLLAWHSDDMAWIEFSNNKPIYSINESVVRIGFSNLSLSGMDNNYDGKNRGSQQFYRDIVINKLQLFSKSERLMLLMQYEISIKRIGKVNPKEWFLLILNYIKIFRLIPFAKLIRRVFISICTE